MKKRSIVPKQSRYDLLQLLRRLSQLFFRPPGALAEHEFLGRCVRCAECLQVCIGNALQPSLLEGGIDGIFTPNW